MSTENPQTDQCKLAFEGGTPVRNVPWPARRLFGEQEKQAAIRVFDEAIESGAAFGYEGAHEQAYCRAFARTLGGGFADAVNSGSSAVYVALRALDPKPFSEVIVPACTDCGGVMPVPLLNCIPVPADCAPGSYNVGAEQIEARITDHTSAIIVAHLAGQPADMSPIMELARSRGLPVLEDCSQAHGAVYRNQPVGTWGDIAAFSTMSGKHHATGAQGGVVFTKDQPRYWHVRRIADRGKPFGLDGEMENVLASHNLNQNELASAIGLVQLDKLPGIVAARRRIAQAVAAGCATLPAIRVIVDAPGTKSSFWFLLVEVETDQLTCDKDTFARAVAAEGIAVTARYDVRVCRERWFRERQIFSVPGLPWTSPSYGGDPDRGYPTPNADRVVDSQFRINIHENCGDREVSDIIAALAKVTAAYHRG